MDHRDPMAHEQDTAPRGGVSSHSRLGQLRSRKCRWADQAVRPGPFLHQTRYRRRQCESKQSPDRRSLVASVLQDVPNLVIETGNNLVFECGVDQICERTVGELWRHLLKGFL